MTFNHFKESLENFSIPKNLNPLLSAMWYDAVGNWQEAHNIVNNNPGSLADWIHAYLHRKEGAIWNAQYWYGRAGKKMPACSIEEEWEDIVKSLLN